MLRSIFFISVSVMMFATAAAGQFRLGFLAEASTSHFKKDTRYYPSPTDGALLSVSSESSKNNLGLGITGKYSFSHLFLQLGAVVRQNNLTFRLIRSIPDDISDTMLVSHQNLQLSLPIVAGLYYKRINVASGVVPRVLLNRHTNSFGELPVTYKKRNLDVSFIVQAEFLPLDQLGVRLSYEKSFSRMGDFVYVNGLNSDLRSREQFFSAAIVLYLSNGSNMKARKCVRRPEYRDIIF